MAYPATRILTRWMRVVSILLELPHKMIDNKRIVPIKLQTMYFILEFIFSGVGVEKISVNVILFS